MQIDNMVLCAGTLGSTPLLDRLEPARAAGFTGISVFASECLALAEQGISLSELNRRIQDAGIDYVEVEIIGKWMPAQKPGPAMQYWCSDAMMGLTPEAILPIASALDAQSVTVAEGFGVPFHAESMAEGFAKACDHFQPEGIDLSLEFITGTTISTLEQAWQIIQLANRPNGGILLDSWHFYKGGSSLETLRTLPGSAITSIQLNDGASTTPDDNKQAMVSARLLPGDGAFPLTELMQVIRSIGSTARVGVEVFSQSLAALPPAEAAEQSGQAMRALLAQP